MMALVLALMEATSSEIMLCMPVICDSRARMRSELALASGAAEAVGASFGGFSKMHSIPTCLHLRQGGFSGPSQRAFCLRQALQARCTLEMVL